MLVLDEPTNHLDLESREALEQALQEFSGSLLLVSHDRALLDAVGTRTISLEDKTLHSHIGGWPEYLRVRDERAKQPADRPKPKRKPPAPRQAGEPDTQTLERQIEVAEAALRALEDELADPSAWATPEKSADSTARHEEAKRTVEELYSRWEAAATAS